MYCCEPFTITTTQCNWTTFNSMDYTVFSHLSHIWWNMLKHTSLIFTWNLWVQWQNAVFLWTYSTHSLKSSLSDDDTPQKQMNKPCDNITFLPLIMYSINVKNIEITQHPTRFQNALDTRVPYNLKYSMHNTDIKCGPEQQCISVDNMFWQS